MVECSLVRYIHRDLEWRPDVEEPVEVIARRRFHARNTGAIWLYEAALSRAAQEARAGEYGCQVAVLPLKDGSIEIVVTEKVIDGMEFRQQVLATRRFDATAENAVVRSAEALAELRAWADERNRHRIERVMAAEATEPGVREQAGERERASRELADILSHVDERGR